MSKFCRFIILFLIIFFWVFFFSLYFDEQENDSVAAFNLVEGVDVPAIEAKIAQYQEENAEQIMINRAHKVLEKLLLLGSVIFSLIYVTL